MKAFYAYALATLVAALMGLAEARPTKLTSKTFDEVVAEGKVTVSQKEKTVRKAIFDANQAKVDEHNAKPTKTYTKTLYSNWADKTSSEWSSKITSEIQIPKRVLPKNNRNLRKSEDKTPTAAEIEAHARMLQLPGSLDWSSYLGPAEYMGDNCASSYAFTAGGALESLMNIKTSTVWNMSKQWAMDCTYPNAGCAGGHPAHVFNNMIWDGGFEQTSDYMWNGTSQTCLPYSVEANTYIDGWYMPMANNDVYLMTSTYERPTISTIRLDENIFFDYENGVVDEWFQQQQPNFFALVVGWGVDYIQGLAYWKVRMPFGPDWGENGYIRLARDPGYYVPSGQCGLTVSMFAPYRN